MLPGHMMTARDILTLAEHIYADFPEYYHYFGEKEFTFNNIKQGNRNPLLYKDLGVDGLKTGHLAVSGFGLVASAKQGDRRIFMVAHGMTSMQSRSDEAAKLIDWAFQSFQNVKLAKAGDQLEQAPVWYGERRRGGADRRQGSGRDAAQGQSGRDPGQGGVSRAGAGAGRRRPAARQAGHHLEQRHDGSAAGGGGARSTGSASSVTSSRR